MVQVKTVYLNPCPSGLQPKAGIWLEGEDYNWSATIAILKNEESLPPDYLARLTRFQTALVGDRPRQEPFVREGTVDIPTLRGHWLIGAPPTKFPYRTERGAVSAARQTYAAFLWHRSMLVEQYLESLVGPGTVAGRWRYSEEVASAIAASNYGYLLVRSAYLGPINQWPSTL